MRIVTMPIQSQGIITRDNVGVDIAAVAYFRVVDAREIGGGHRECGCRDRSDRPNDTAQCCRPAHPRRDGWRTPIVINANIRADPGCDHSGVGCGGDAGRAQGMQLPDSMKRAMARQAEAEREQRAKIIAAEGESLAAAALGDASDTMMAHPLALQLRNLQTLVELGVDKNTTVVFPAQLMSAIGDIGAFFARETAATATTLAPPITAPTLRQAQDPTERPSPTPARTSLLCNGRSPLMSLELN